MELRVSSPAFREQDWIPDCYSGYGEDRSPELHIDGIDANAKSLIITLDDADHPLFTNFNHWVAWNIPPVNKIPGKLPKGEIIEEPIHLEQGKAYGKHGYRGPKPPFNWMHKYRFTVYALDTILSLSTNADKKKVLEAAEGHILQRGILVGMYQRKHK